MHIIICIVCWILCFILIFPLVRAILLYCITIGYLGHQFCFILMYSNRTFKLD